MIIILQNKIQKIKGLDILKDRFQILIVDDVIHNLIALNALLASDEVNISQAMSGNEALDLMLNQDFSLALLDVQMPEMTGFELAKFMHGTNKTKNIPIIFITAGEKDKNYFFSGLESSAVDYVQKPLDPAILKNKVNVFLKLHRQKLKNP